MPILLEALGPQASPTTSIPPVPLVPLGLLGQGFAVETDLGKVKRGDADNACYGKSGSDCLAIFPIIFRSSSFSGTRALAWARSRAIVYVISAFSALVVIASKSCPTANLLQPESAKPPKVGVASPRRRCLAASAYALWLTMTTLGKAK